MGKCVIEAPRGGSHRRNVKIRAYGRITQDDEGYDYEGISKIPCSRKGAKLMTGDCKDFSDKLGPLRGYLENSCGRLWDAVWSEIKQTLGHAGRGVQHIVDAHINVAKHTYRHANGHVYTDDAKSYPHNAQVDYSYARYSQHDFYVEPETGILQKTIRVPRPVEHKPIKSIAISANSEYRLIDGLWYYREFRETEEKVFKGYVVNGVRQYEWVQSIAWTVKRQLGKKELKKLCRQLLSKRQ